MRLNKRGKRIIERENKENEISKEIVGGNFLGLKKDFNFKGFRVFSKINGKNNNLS